MNQKLTERCSRFLAMTLASDYTSVSYALQIGGQLVMADALGWQDKPQGRPADLQCTYNVASVSKIYCTAAVMILVQRGLVELDAPVVRYIPDFTMADPRYRRITVRHLLNHSSALPGTQWQGFSVTRRQPGRNYHQEVLDYLAISHLKAEPGEVSVYCNDGFTLAEILVERVSGQSYGEFLRQHITDPIGALSTRTIENQNPDYPLVREKDKPQERLLVEGAAGITTTMIDLCRFGQLFLTENAILSAASVQEMARAQGVTFLAEDEKSRQYGLGWDTVSCQDPWFDLGEGALRKGGNSFQFTTQFLVVPQYQAVVALSQTHDCRIDAMKAACAILAMGLQQVRGIQLVRGGISVSESQRQQLCGLYLQPGSILNVQMEGALAHIQKCPVRGEGSPMVSYLRYDGSRWQAQPHQSYHFVEARGHQYLMCTQDGVGYPIAMKAPGYPPLSETWRKRLGKQYVVIGAYPQDLVIGELMSGFTLLPLPGVDGVMVASFSGRKDSDIYGGGFEGTFVAVDEVSGRGLLDTPYNGSRDLLDPLFFQQDGVECCQIASYRYQRADTLPVYQGQSLKTDDAAQSWQLKQTTALPMVPSGRRLIVLDDEMNVVEDSLRAPLSSHARPGVLLFF